MNSSNLLFVNKHNIYKVKLTYLTNKKMALSDFLKDNVGVDIGSAGNIGGVFQGFAIFMVVAIIVSIGTFFWANRKSYNKHIHLFEEISGQAVASGQDLAKEIVLPHTSTRAFYLKKRRIFLPRGSIQTGKNHYWYFIRNDGEWVNIGITNLNKELTRLGIKFDHTDMRMANASLKKLVEKNYKKLNWLKEYAPYIGFGILILMLGVAGFLIFNEAGKNLGMMSGLGERLSEISENVADMLVSVDNIRSSSGVRVVE